jgi:putative ABC transport system permease protein
VSRVSPGYFETMGVRLVGGRFFDEHDQATSPNVVIVDERLAGRFWPGVNPVGKRMFEPSDEKDITAITPETKWYEVVGVIGEVKLRGLIEGVGETGAYYLPSTQQIERRFTFAIRTTTDPETLSAPLHSAIASIDRELPLYGVQTMTERAARSLLTRRSSMAMALSFGVVALLLSAVGLYGVLAYLVTQRTKEIGIRLALGSSTPAVFSLVLREGLLLLGTGLALGVGGAMVLSRSLEQELVGVRASDPLVGVLAAIVLIAVALVACALPARRATRIDPVIALAE